MPLKAEPFEKSKTFDALSLELTQREGLVGKLKAIDRAGDFTVAVIEETMAYPADRRVTLRKVEKDDAPAPEGYTLVCRGTCWDVGKEAKVIAIRKKKA